MQPLLGVACAVLGMTTFAVPVGAYAEPPPYDEEPTTDTTYDDTTYNDTYDPTYDDTYDPTYDTTYDTIYDDTYDPTYDTIYDTIYDDTYDPTTSTTTRSPLRLAPAQDGWVSIDDAALTDVEPSQAPRVGAGRMLLAIDAIAELGGFERAITPNGAALLRDIREGIAAEGLDEAGYTIELEKFVDDFIPFLESLEANGVDVSDNLWDAAFGLESVLFGEVDTTISDSADVGLLPPQPWLQGLADLLVRRGEFPIVPNPESDENDIRDLLAGFAASSHQDSATPTTDPEEPPPTVLALETGTETTSTGSGRANLTVMLGLGALCLAGLLLTLALRRPKRPALAGVSALHPERSLDGSTSATPSSPTAKASAAKLLDASQRMSASLDAATIASIALAEAKRIVDAQGGIVVRRTDTGLDPVGCEPPTLFNYEHLSDGSLTKVIETGQSIAEVAHEGPLFVEAPQAACAVPIVTGGMVIGAILLVRTSDQPFNRDEVDALEMLAPLVGSAFAVADRHETAVDVEPLTGLQNRRRLDVDLASISTDDEVAYVMVDIDHFKNFNDTNGHAAGDEALRQVSALLQASVRPNDLVYRYGGEEFCVLLPATSAEEAAVVAERARAAVESANIPGMENQPDGVVTISVGVSDSAFGSPDDLVERADAALYVSKRNGRNQVTLSHPG